MLKTLCKLLKDFRDDEDGSSLIEMAIFSTVMILTIPLMSSFADRINAQQRLNMGVRSGLQYMMANQSVSSDTLSDIVETSGAGSNYPVTATSAVSCECSGGVSVTCGTTCTGGATPSKYLTVTASTNITNFWGQQTQTVTQQTTVRVE